MIKNRYEIRESLGSGGMGVVYRAFDSLMRRDVALKTIRDVPSGVFISFFHRECSILAAMAHPNIVEIFDMGEFVENGISKPYFVMPLLRGRTLYNLIYSDKLPLAAHRCIDIISQVCRGLQAAHEQGLVHRDIKPRNIFVMQDDAVKIIDFGIAHPLGSNSTGIRGTPPYMSPEQLSYKPLTNRSDIFSLATVCYEALAATNPFARNTDAETANAVIDYIPLPITEINPAVSRSVAQVVAKAMAKDPRQRFESVAIFGEHLQKALRNEPITLVNVGFVQSRIERARRSFTQGDYEFASEIIRELEAEGYNDVEIGEIRRSLDEVVRKHTNERLIESAKRCYEESEYALALRKVQEILDAEPSHNDALLLKGSIESTLAEQKLLELLRVARDYIQKAAFNSARQIIQEVMRVNPGDSRAKLLLSEVDAKQKELLRQKQDQERLYQKAQTAWLQGEIGVALEALKQLVNTPWQTDESRERANEYKEFHRRVHAEHEAVQSALEQGQRLLQDQDLAGAQRLCARYLGKYPKHSGFVELEQRRKVQEAELATSHREFIKKCLNSEPRLELQIAILEEAAQSRPEEPYFQQELEEVKEKHRQVEEMVQQAKHLEQLGDFAEAVEAWRRALLLNPAQPGLQDEVARAQNLQRTCLFLKKGSEAIAEERFEEAVNFFRQASHESCENSDLRKLVFRTLLKQAEEVTSRSWRCAESILGEVDQLNCQIIPETAWKAIRVQQQKEAIADTLRCVTQKEAEGRWAEARAHLQEALKAHPEEGQLQTRLRSIELTVAKFRLREDRAVCRKALEGLRDELELTKDPGHTGEILLRVQTIAGGFITDAAINPIVIDIGEQISMYEEAQSALADDRVKEALQLCDVILARKPEYSMFLFLKAKTEVRERELEAEYLNRVEGDLRDEINLEKQIQILAQALQEHPRNVHLQEELNFVSSKQMLVASIVERAQYLEKDGVIVKALEEWKYLQSVHPLYPGLQDAIEKLASLDVLQRQDSERRLQVEGLVSQGHSNLKNGQYAEGQDQFFAASQSAPGESEAARTMARYLLQYAELAFPADWKRAESMIQQAHSLASDIPVAKELQAALMTVHEREDLDQCLNLIRSLETKADFAAAYEESCRFLAKYPDHKQLQAIQSRLANTIANLGNTLKLVEQTHFITGENKQDQEPTWLDAEAGKVLPAMIQIRTYLQAAKVIEAEELCQRAMGSFPQHPGFLELLVEIKDRQDEVATEHLKKVEQELAAEHDWNRKTHILEEAFRLYPNERYYSEELALVRNKQDLLNAHIAKARDFEVRQMYEDAFHEWEALNTMYPELPEIADEIHRVSEAWQRHEEVRQLLHVSKDLLSQGRMQEGGKMLSRVFDLLPSGDSTLQADIVPFLLEQAQIKLHEDNWQVAQELIYRLRSLCPDYKVPPDLSNAIAHAEYESELEQFLIQLDEAELHQDRTALMRLVSHGRARYLTDLRAKQKTEAAALLINQIEENRPVVLPVNTVAGARDNKTGRTQSLLVRSLLKYFGALIIMSTVL